MLIQIQIGNRNYDIDPQAPLDISIPLDFYGEQPNAYGVEKASSQPCRAGALLGDTRRGGSCNFEQLTLIPHCNGTHTECVGHITHERIFVRDCLQEAFTLAALVSVEPEKAASAGETYATAFGENDLLITRRALEAAVSNLEKKDPKIRISSFDSLVVRTLPNDESKKSRVYLEATAPYFSTEAISWMVERGVSHLLVDTPSIDRLFDEGKLSNHRIFWQIEQGSFALNEKSLIRHTISEMIYVPDRVSDGLYLLNLQIPSFAADAAPSRPLLFECLG